jgi:prepilin-type N-terminal cleavage/methylation domain-containing protein
MMSRECVRMRSRTRDGDAAGFTLVEVLVASAVMTVGVYAVLAVFPQALRITRDSGRLSTLSHLAAQQVEYLRSIDYGSSELALGTHPTIQTDAGGSKYYPVSGFDEVYSMRWIVTAGPTTGSGSAQADMKTVRIEATHRIRYDDSGNVIDNPEGLSVVLRTFIADE